jgi:hypothetical protein
MARGKGVKLQSYRGKDKLSDAMVFDSEDGMIVMTGDRNRAFPEWREWLGKRAHINRCRRRRIQQHACRAVAAVDRRAMDWPCDVIVRFGKRRTWWGRRRQLPRPPCNHVDS